jgi:hypothetical protein
MSFSSALRALLSCFGSSSSSNNNNNNKGPPSPSIIVSASFSRVYTQQQTDTHQQSGPRRFFHLETGDSSVPMRPFVSTPPPYVQPERP